MRAATRPGGSEWRRHHTPVLADFRLTWRQALLQGLRAGGLGSGVMIAVVSAVPAEPEVPELAWLAVLAPLPLGLLYGTLARFRARTQLDDSGIRGRSFGAYALVPWCRVWDVRAERRRARTVVAVYLADGATLRLRAPYDGGPLDRDPRFEQKLVMICQLWESHRHGGPGSESQAGQLLP
jgi:hypothetical protein